MKSLVNGCAVAALLMGLAVHAHAEIAVREAPVHIVPADEDSAPEAAAPADADDAVAAPAPAGDKTAPAIVVAKAEPAAVKALMQPKPPTTQTPEENAFFAVLGARVTDAASAYESYVRRRLGLG